MPNLIPGVATSGIPAAVIYPDGKSVFIAWKGQDNDQGIYWTRTRQLAPDAITGAYTFDPSPQARIWDVATSHSPALASFQSQVYMAWKGEEGDERIFWSSYDGVKWQPQTPIPNASTKIAPAVVALDAAIFIVWKNAADDKIFWAMSFQDQRTNRLEFNVKGPVHAGTTGFQTTHTPALARIDGRNFCMAWTGITDPYYMTWSAFNIDDQWALRGAMEPFIWADAGLGAGPTITSPALQYYGDNQLLLAWVAPGSPFPPPADPPHSPYLVFSYKILNAQSGWQYENTFLSSASTPALAGDAAFFYKKLDDPYGIYYATVFDIEGWGVPNNSGGGLKQV